VTILSIDMIDLITWCIGVKFLYECVMGLRKHEGQGCILADEMFVASCLVSEVTHLYDSHRGLGKTLQVRSCVRLNARD